MKPEPLLRQILTAAFLTLLVSAYGQYYPLPDISYNWKHAKPDTIAVKPKWSKADAVVLDDQLTISVRGKKRGFVYVYFERKQRIRLQNSVDGKLPFTRFVLPESLDPFYDARDIPLVLKPEMIPADYLNTRMIYFAARKVLGDGETREIVFRDSLQEGYIEIGNRFEKQFRYVFELDGIARGDEIEVYYKYEVPYAYNSLFFNDQRIFFHRSYPVQKQRVEIAVPKSIVSKTIGRVPDEAFTKDKRDVLAWNNQDLPGCIDEVAIRPGRDLPHLIFTLFHDNPELRNNQELSFQQYVGSYSARLFREREQNVQWLRRIASGTGQRDIQAQQITQFIDSVTDGLSPDNVTQKFDRIHSLITNKFNYQWDDAYFSGDDFSLEKIGDQIGQQRLREISRYNLYARLINRLGEKYYTTYILDERIGSMSAKYTGNINFADFAFALPDGDYLSLYYPKKDQFGYEPNEFPFYLAGSSAFFVDYDRLVTEPDYFPELIELPGVPDENYRHTVVNLYINTDSWSATGDIRTELSGQFSTLTRSVFDFGRADSSINSAYGIKPLEGLGTTYINLERLKAEMYAPYSRIYELDCQVELNQVKEWRTGCEIPLRNWFNFITWPDLDPYTRVLPFYVDFQGDDFMRIHLYLDKNVTLSKGLPTSFQRQNRYGSVAFKVEQAGPKHIVLEAYFNQYGNRIEPEKVSLITELYQAIAEMEERVVELRWPSE